MSIFSSVPVGKKGHTNFDESHSVSGTFPLSLLCPVFWCDTIPGDRWKINVFNHTKLETMIAPAMQRIQASLLWFKLPKRLCFKHFKKWYSGGFDGRDNHEKPHFHLTSFFEQVLSEIDRVAGEEPKRTKNIQKFTEEWFGPGTLWNYMGLPVPLAYDKVIGQWYVKSIDDFDWESEIPEGKEDVDFIDLIPLIGYNLIFDCYFRDQTLSDGVFEDAEESILILNDQGLKFTDVDGNSHNLSGFTPSGKDLSEGGEFGAEDVMNLLSLHRRAWQKDYFTSALPTPQRGPEVKIGISDDNAPVVQDDDINIISNQGSGANVSISQDSNMLSYASGGGDYTDLDLSIRQKDDLTRTGLSVDLSGLSPITITAFRNLFKLQAFLEKNNVGGGRFIETILAQWGVRVPDFTVQRPQFVRATSIPVQITEVLATANSAGVNSQVGDQAGHAAVRGNLGSVRMYTHEPSLIFGLYCVGIPPTYVNQGISRFFQHVTRFDEPWIDFQHIGEQNIKLRELWYPFGDLTQVDKDFGYQQRFSEYKYIPDRVVGDFVTSLSYWHMARMFDTKPSLNEDFVMQHPDERIFAVKSSRPVFSDFFFDCKANRELSKYSTPKLT